MEALHPNVRYRWGLLAVAAAVAIGAAVAGLGIVLLDGAGIVGAAVALLVLPVALWLVLARYRSWGYEVQTDALYLERGVITRVETAVPFVRVQHVDTQRGPLERLLGLSRVVVYTAGSRGADVTVPGLAPNVADALHDRLRALAVESEPDDGV